MRHAFRTLRKSPGYTAVAVLTLAAGIAANTTMFSVVRSVLLRPLPYRDPGRLVTLLHRGTSPVAPDDFLDWRSQSRSFESMAAACAWSANMSGREQAEHVTGLQLSDGLFDLLGVAPLHGRTPTRDEYAPGGQRVVVLGHGLWQRMFGGDPGVLGRSVVMNGEPRTVVGIMPPQFRFAPFWITQAEVWAPLPLSEHPAGRSAQFLRVFARLKPGASLRQAQAEMDTIAQRLARAYPDTNTGRTVKVDPLHEQAVGKVRPALTVLAGAVGFVLLIACANVAGLALARAVGRRREIAIRLALGAGRGRIFRQLLTESLIVSLAAGVAGTALAFWGVAALRVFLAQTASQVSEISVDALSLAFAALVSVLSGVLFGVAPALEAMRANVNDTLGEGGRSGAETGRSTRLRGALVVAEVAISLVLLAGAGLLLRSFLRLRAFEPGFQARGVLTMVVSPQYGSERREAFYRQALAELRSLPGVESASAVNHLPVGGDVWGSRVYAEGRPVPPPGEEEGAVYRVCRPGYFGAMGIRLLAGRDFTMRDDKNAPAAVVVTQSLARRLWPGEDAIGKRLTTDDPRKNPAWLTVVGVVGDVAQRWSRQPDPEFYIPYFQDRAFSDTTPQRASMTVVVRTAGDPLRFANSARAVVRAFDKDIAVSQVRSLEQVIGESMLQARLQFALLGVFAGFAILLAAVGIYGVMAYSVSRRTHEIGIRMALGARQGSVLWLVLRQGLAMVLAGMAAGLAGAFALTRWLSGLLYGVSATDPATFAAVPALLAAVALLASYLPARRASAVDPARALRSE